MATPTPCVRVVLPLLAALLPAASGATQTRYLGPNHLVTLRGGAKLDFYGLSVTGVGDVDLDGHPDVAVGAPGADTSNGVDSGLLTVYSGRDFSVLKVIAGSGAGDRFGTGVRSAGDVDKDGRLDLIVSAPGDDAAGKDAGAAAVFSGKDWSVLRVIRGDRAGQKLSAVSGAGDVDGDGHADVIVGATWDHTKAFEAGVAVAVVDLQLLAQIHQADDTVAVVVGADHGGVGQLDLGDLGAVELLDGLDLQHVHAESLTVEFEFQDLDLVGS